VRILIRYLLRGESVPRVLELSPQEYFDPLNDGEILSVGSVPKHQDAFEYTGCRAHELYWTALEIREGETFWRVRTQFLDGLRSLMTHSSQSDGTEEVIHQTEIGPRCWHTIRTLREPGRAWAVVANNLTVETPAQLADSRDYCGTWSFDQLKAFGNTESSRLE
jgi:hypothetical protein